MKGLASKRAVNWKGIAGILGAIAGVLAVVVPVVTGYFEVKMKRMQFDHEERVVQIERTNREREGKAQGEITDLSKAITELKTTVQRCSSDLERCEQRTQGIDVCSGKDGGRANCPKSPITIQATQGGR